MAKQKIVENVPRDLVLGEVVLTGGAAQLPGIEAIAEEVFGLPVRVGMPKTVGGLTEAMAAPQYATAIGLVLFGANGERDAALRVGRRGGAFVTRVQRWLADLWT
jgi:cell division protein FtsA